MIVDKVLEKQIKKFDIDPETKLNRVEKYLSHDERWEILKKFFKQKEIPNAKILVDEINKQVIINFEKTSDAKKFSKFPSEGLPAFARQCIREKGEDFTKYDIYFNLGIMYNEKNDKRVILWNEK